MLKNIVNEQGRSTKANSLEKYDFKENFSRSNSKKESHNLACKQLNKSTSKEIIKEEDGAMSSDTGKKEKLKVI